MVANREILPIRHQCILLSPEHGAYICGMVQGGVEISVISNRGREMHLDLVLRHQSSVPEIIIISDSWIVY